MTDEHDDEQGEWQVDVGPSSDLVVSTWYPIDITDYLDKHIGPFRVFPPGKNWQEMPAAEQIKHVREIVNVCTMITSISQRRHGYLRTTSPQTLAMQHVLLEHEPERVSYIAGQYEEWFNELLTIITKLEEARLVPRPEPV